MLFCFTFIGLGKGVAAVVMSRGIREAEPTCKAFAHLRGGDSAQKLFAFTLLFKVH